MAFDFDQTLIGIHTGGCWKHSVEELKPHVRPMFRTMLPAALDRGLYVGIVTFSPQVDMIRSILEDVVGQERAQYIPIRGGMSGGFVGVPYQGGASHLSSSATTNRTSTGTATATLSSSSHKNKAATTTTAAATSNQHHHAWVYHGQGSHQGKQAHMASVVEELEQRHEGLEIHKTSTLLIDDDGKNIRTALQEGVRAVWLNPRKPSQVMKDIINLI